MNRNKKNPTKFVGYPICNAYLFQQVFSISIFPAICLLQLLYAARHTLIICRSDLSLLKLPIKILNSSNHCSSIKNTFYEHTAF
jgi:hypothetical protein